MNSVFGDCCAVCEDEALRNEPMGFLKRKFIICPDCGNKRCPKASAHWQACSGSNEPGQVGSFYGPKESWPVPQSSEEKRVNEGQAFDKGDG